MKQILIPKGMWSLIAIIALFLISTGIYFAVKSHDTTLGKLQNQLSLALDSTIIVKTTNGQLVQQINDNRKANSDQLKAASDSIFKLNAKQDKLIKEVSRLAVIGQAVHLKDTIAAHYDNPERQDLEDTSCEHLRELYQYAVFTPSPFSYNSDSINLQGVVLTDGVAITSVDITDSLYERDVKLKTGFLNFGRKYSTQIHHSNSLFSSNEAAVFTVNKTPNWWYRTGKPSAGFIAGAAITYAIFHFLIPAKH